MRIEILSSWICIEAEIKALLKSFYGIGDGVPPTGGDRIFPVITREKDYVRY
ncbi:hypothetical protein GNE08_08740 [Trichormus variabilis ARAD]|uniref:Uncharacterized protein n=1 Tax=Trichormus variabilis N2B TaxID=2681315 RepID=A0ABR6S915_ANAVA|nr:MULTISPECIES: hypothetical protein [Nostocaceae]MBC1214310.1 hypothetical protein [Trichormus variabilis ARAD]MBC1254455.1 hypothetical protein [Trichormus variabilis V5]MBC1268039.1 hypothetical protein [Trichormus variabilis FSR]MBC1302885.1 hypothetical protein [Trichormus variabilis N2B]MBC1310977.1 hypothetical protein [Trichormus variabilis PNB]